MAKKKKIVIEEENESTAPDASADVTDGGEENSRNQNAGDLQADLEEKLAAARADADEQKDRMLRMAAELDNFKKRAAREQDELRKYANEGLIRQLLCVVDNLERAIASASGDSENDRSVVDGVAMTLKEIMKILEKHHVSPINALGEAFDPVFHQAMSQEECDDRPPNTVVQEYQKGYLIHDRLLRPAMVVVSKASQGVSSDNQSIDTKA
ncbi:MAG: nucleotide exchange factor GrpE [Proteobacteria bacterium]|nr:MAG: nucleotide exchange factor GrpE [Pseudomonadota bacterium]